MCASVKDIQPVTVINIELAMLLMKVGKVSQEILILDGQGKVCQESVISPTEIDIVEKIRKVRQDSLVITMTLGTVGKVVKVSQESLRVEIEIEMIEIRNSDRYSKDSCDS